MDSSQLPYILITVDSHARLRKADSDADQTASTTLKRVQFQCFWMVGTSCRY